MPTLGPRLLTAVATATIAVVLLIASAASPTVCLFKINSAAGVRVAKSDLGMFRGCTTINTQSKTCVTYDSNDYTQFEDLGVEDAEERVRASQAFVIIGILVGTLSAVASAALMINLGPPNLAWLVAIASGTFASLSALIVWAIWANIIYELDNISSSRLLLNASASASPGASFALAVVAFVLLLASTGMAAIGKQEASAAIAGSNTQYKEFLADDKSTAVANEAAYAEYAGYT